MLDLQPVLQSKTLLLRPLENSDFAQLFNIASDRLLWEQHPNPDRYKKIEFEKWFTAAIESKGTMVAIDIGNSDSIIVGTSRFYRSYYTWQADNNEIAIGYTFIQRSLWGSGTNIELKKLMLNYAFHHIKIVWLHVGANNIRSQKAVEKIGAKYSHRQMIEMADEPIEYIFYKMYKSDCVIL